MNPQGWHKQLQGMLLVQVYYVKDVFEFPEVGPSARIRQMDLYEPWGVFLFEIEPWLFINIFSLFDSFKNTSFLAGKSQYEGWND